MSAPVGGKTVHEQMLAWARRQPRRPALVCGGRTTTYGDLAAGTLDTARALSALGLTAESHVAVRMPRGEDLVAALLGTLAAGLAYVPIDRGLPGPRVDAILASARPGAFIDGTRPRTAHPAVPFSVTRPAWPQQLAYTIYTSGSTGTPKGVGVTHEALTHFVRSVDPILDAAGQRRVLAASAISFDIAVLEIFWPLSRGHCVYLADDAETAQPAELLRLIAEYRIDLVQATPSRWAILLSLGSLPPGVTAVSGGEALSSALAAELARSADRVLNFYGPTETCVYSMAGQVTAADGLPPRLGAPLGATTLAIRDPGGDITEEGELWIGGPGVARGYLNDPRRTAAAFVPDEAGPPGARVYRTGDRVRRTPRGIAFIGRLDDQVKIRGSRVEAGDIESNARRHPDVINAAAIFDSGTSWLFYASRTGRRIDGLAEFLAGQLPDYMVPDEFFHLPRMPLTSSGKADRAQLREAAHAAVTEPSSLITVRQAMSAVLGVHVGADTDFFAAGADSLMAARLAARLSRRSGVELTVARVMELRTASAIERYLTATKRGDVGTLRLIQTQPLAKRRRRSST